MFFILIGLMITYIIISQKVQIETFSSSLSFVPLDYMYSVVYGDKSGFFDNMNQRDLHARNVHSVKDYKRLYSTSFRHFTSDEKAMLSGYINTCDKLVISKTKRLQNIPWKFAKLDKTIENGWPHTLHDVIVLPSNFLERGHSSNDIIDILIHEKIHVYQRVHPDLTISLLRSWGFTQTQVPHYILPIMRSNPDLSGFFQYQSKAPVQLYNKMNPSSIADARVEVIDITSKELKVIPNGISMLPFPPEIVKQTEHPYEVMATIIPVIYLQPEKLPRNNYLVTATKNWAGQYL